LRGEQIHQQRFIRGKQLPRGIQRQRRGIAQLRVFGKLRRDARIKRVQQVYRLVDLVAQRGLIGRIALRAGMGEIEVEEGALLSAFEEIAGRFRKGGSRTTKAAATVATGASSGLAEQG